MAKQKNELPKRSGDRKNGSTTSIVWYLIAAAAAGLFAVSLFTATGQVDLSYSELEQLIRATGDAGPEGSIDVLREDGSSRRVYRFRGLEDVMIGAYEVTGTVIVEMASEDVAPSVSVDDLVDSTESAAETASPEPATPIGGSNRRRFQTAKLPSENSEGQLSRLLDEHGVPYRYEDPPSAWQNWAPMLVMTGLFIVLFFVMIRRIGGAGSPMAFGRSRGKM